MPIAVSCSPQLCCVCRSLYLAIGDRLLLFHFQRIPLDVFHLDGVRHLLGRLVCGHDGLLDGRLGGRLYRQRALGDRLAGSVLRDTPKPALRNMHHAQIKSGAAFSKVPRKILGKRLILGATDTQLGTSSRGYSDTVEHCTNRPVNSVQRSNRKLCSSSIVVVR